MRFSRVTGLRNAFGEDFLKDLPYSSVEDLDEDIQLNSSLWRARDTIMRYSQYDSLEAKASWRRIVLMKIVPITYHGFLCTVAAQYTFVRSHSPLKPF